jgi:hypothetical protein
MEVMRVVGVIYIEVYGGGEAASGPMGFIVGSEDAIVDAI